MTKEASLGKYILYEQLGRGGYGTVYRAYDTVLKVERAVKLLHPALLADPEFLERFRNEAQLAARLEHPHIVPVHDLGETEGSVFLAMKFMPGGSLKDVLKRVGNLPFEKALEITRQVAGALAYAHAQAEKWVHRDIKPGNILFEGDPLAGGNARLADFGFAKALQGGGSASLSASGAMIGTPAYMAPEIWMGQPASPRTDEYSLACMFYEMITGESLFGGGETPPPLVMKRHFDPLVLPEKWPEGVPEGINQVLEKALAKEPGERFSGTEAFAQALEGLKALGGQPSVASEKKEPEKLKVEEPPAEQLRTDNEIRQNQVMEVAGPVNRAANPPYPSEPVKRDFIPYYPDEPKKNNRWTWVVGLCGLIVIAFLALPGLISRIAPTATFAPSPSANPVETSMPVLGIGSTQVSPLDGMVMVYAPEGNFKMGSNDGKPGERPLRTVILAAYWIDRTEVTNGMYTKCVLTSACQPPRESGSLARTNYFDDPQYADYPVIHVDWNDANAYCSWAGRSLPSEAEWEKAARGTDGRIYPWGDTAPDITLLNYDFNEVDTSKVGSYPAGTSPYGALDMAGNVWEWVAGWYDVYPGGDKNASTDFGTKYRVMRGGSWGVSAIPPTTPLPSNDVIIDGILFQIPGQYKYYPGTHGDDYIVDADYRHIVVNLSQVDLFIVNGKLVEFDAAGHIRQTHTIADLLAIGITSKQAGLLPIAQYENYLRSADRAYLDDVISSAFLGFRCAKSAD
jgi:eukaryotic-like serine/threonine-protein kinase